MPNEASQLLDAMPIAACLLERATHGDQWCVAGMTPRFARLLDSLASRGGMRPGSPRDLLGTDGEPAVTGRLDAGEPFEIEFEARKSDGQRVWAALRGYPLSGKATRYLLLATEIDVEAFGTRHGDAPHFDRWVAAADIAVLRLSPEGRVAFASPASERIWQSSRGELIGRCVDELMTSTDMPGVPVTEQLGLTTPTIPRRFVVTCKHARGDLSRVEIVATRPAEPFEQSIIVTIHEPAHEGVTQEKIRSLAYHDLLTGLPNRLLFCDMLADMVHRARRSGRQVVCILVDLDRFRLFNDSLGMSRGDEIIRQVSERLCTCVGAASGAVVARLGSDQFMICMDDLDDAGGASAIADDIFDCLRSPIVVSGHELSITASVGAAVFPHDGDDAETLIQNSDIALNRAKQKGRNSFQLFTGDMNTAAFERLMLETRLRKALSHEELEMHYQPQVDAHTGRIIGIEALLRWQHPELGTISPADFIPLAEETGLIVPIGEWALEQSCRQLSRWHDQGHASLRVAVNLSARQFEHRDLVASVRDALDRTGCPPEMLELELTESAIMREGGEVVERLGELRALGPSLAIDDFGTGYSSLAYLKRFPIRSIKIDRSFVRDIDEDHNSAAIAQAIVAMGAALDLKVVAEGVETKDQLMALRRYGCHEVQGYLFGRPLPADELGKLLRSQSAEDDRHSARTDQASTPAPGDTCR